MPCNRPAALLRRKLTAAAGSRFTSPFLSGVGVTLSELEPEDEVQACHMSFY